MQPIPWSDYQDFLSIAHARQIGRAALKLGVDATTLGRRLRRLEARLGRTLFERTREGQVLSEAGEALLAHVEAMQAAADAIAGEGTDSAGDPAAVTGNLRVSVSEGFGTWFVAAHLHEFLARHPALVVDLVATSGFLSPSKREADVAVLLARPRSGPVIARKLSDYALALYAGRGYLAQAGTPHSVEALTGHRFIGYIPDLVYAPELRYLAEVHPDLAPNVRSSSINAQYRLAASDAGIAVLPRFIGDRDRQLVRVVPEVAVARSFWIVTHKDTQRLHRVRLFKTWLTELVQRHRARLAGL